MTFFHRYPWGKLSHWLNRIPGLAYLWMAVPIFGASGAVTRKITEIGAQQFIGGQNPISLCNVLFVGNLCALLVLVMIHRQLWQPAILRQISRKEWLNLVIVAVLSGALAPGLVFQALALTPVTNVVLIGRLQPPLTLALSIWLLRDRVGRWEIIGALTAFLGVVLTIVLQPSTGHPMSMASLMSMSMSMSQIQLGGLLAVLGAIAVAIANIISKQQLAQVPTGIFNVVRTGLGTVIFFGVALVLYGPHHFMGAFSPFLWQWMLLYGGVIVVVGQSFWMAGLRSTSVATAAVVGSFTPIAGILAAYLVLGEVPTQAQIIGGSVILLGLVVSQVGLRQNKSRVAAMPRAGSIPALEEISAHMGYKGV